MTVEAALEQLGVELKCPVCLSLCRELEVLVETNADVALAVLAQRLRISN